MAEILHLIGSLSHYLRVLYIPGGAGFLPSTVVLSTFRNAPTKTGLKQKFLSWRSMTWAWPMWHKRCYHGSTPWSCWTNLPGGHCQVPRGDWKVKDGIYGVRWFVVSAGSLGRTGNFVFFWEIGVISYKLITLRHCVLESGCNYTLRLLTAPFCKWSWSGFWVYKHRTSPGYLEHYPTNLPANKHGDVSRSFILKDQDTF